MATLKQQTSFGPGIYRGHIFSVDRLKAFVDGTNAAIKAGVPIPLLKRHAPINASDDDTVQFAKEEGSGWIKEVFIDSKGNIGFEADNVPAEDAEKATQGTLKFTSPEFRPHYECEKAGVYSGPVIRHFAFTPTPGNPHQGAVEVLAMSESCIQLSEADYQGPIDTQHSEGLSKAFIHDNLTRMGFTSKGKGQGYKRYYHKSGHTVDVHDHGGLEHMHGPTGSHVSVKPEKVEEYFDKLHGYTSQHAELYPADVPSINDLQDSQYKGKGVKYPKHTDDAADDEDHDVNDMANGEGNSIDEEELVDSETKPKKKKGTTNKGEDVDHEQEMDKATNKDVDTQHAEHNDVLSKHGYNLDEPGGAGGYSIYKRKFAGGTDKVHYTPKTGYWEHHSHANQVKSKTGKPQATGRGHSELDKYLSEHHGSGYGQQSQHAEKNIDGFGKPKNDEPNAPAKQPPNDPNLEVMENPEAPIENAPPENPDMPPKATDKTKLSAIIAGLNQLGVVVPSDWDPCKNGSMDILLGCLNTHIKTEQDAEVEENAGQEEDVESPKDAPMPFTEGGSPASAVPFSEDGHTHSMREAREHFYKMEQQDLGEHSITHKGRTVKGTPRQIRHYLHDQMDAGEPYEGGKKQVTIHASQHTEELQFTEDELKAMPAKARKVIEAGQVALKAEREARIKAEQEAIAFAEQEKLTKSMAAKGKAIAEVQAVAIPPALKRQLLDGYQNLQFSEAQDQPLYTGEQVAKMVANALPPALQFMEIETAEGIRPSVSIPVGKDPNTGEVKYKQLRDSEQFFEDSPSEFVMTKERANEIANATTARIQTHHHNVHTFTPTVPLSQMVASENQRVPNNVMNR